MPVCSIPGCGGKPVAWGWCDGHYRRWKRHGDPLGGRTHGLTAEERFWAKVNRSGACWLWTASTYPDGYGAFWDGTKVNGRPHIVKAHQWAYKTFVGPVPTGLEVCHSCDTPSCVNYQDHLFLGTHAENMGDSAAKGRQGVNRRDKNGRAKLTEVQIVEARAAATGRYGEVSELARRFGVTSSTMSKILKGQTWT